MANWSVKCPACKKDFVYSEVDRATLEQSLCDPFKIIPKPSGEKRTCPNCNTESNFTVNHMFYREK
jgi:hypothetical protein